MPASSLTLAALRPEISKARTVAPALSVAQGKAIGHQPNVREPACLFQGEPSSGIRGVGGVTREFSAEAAAHVSTLVHDADHVSRVATNRLVRLVPAREHTRDATYLGVQSRLLFQLALRRLKRGLAPFHSAAGHRPLTRVRVAGLSETCE